MHLNNKQRSIQRNKEVFFSVFGNQLAIAQMFAGIVMN